MDRKSDTRQRLLEAAGEVFAEQGFANATIRDICHRAGANIAAVNYHFGDKEALYVEVLRASHAWAKEKYPHDLGLAPGATAEQRLKAFIHSLLLRVLDQRRPAWRGKLMSRELANPTPALNSLIDAEIRPLGDHLREIVRELLGPGFSEKEVWLMGWSVVSQCTAYHHCSPVVQRLRPDLTYDDACIAELAEHVTRFSLAAMEGVRAQHARDDVRQAQDVRRMS